MSSDEELPKHVLRLAHEGSTSALLGASEEPIFRLRRYWWPLHMVASAAFDLARAASQVQDERSRARIMHRLVETISPWLEAETVEKWREWRWYSAPSEFWHELAHEWYRAFQQAVDYKDQIEPDEPRVETLVSLARSMDFWVWLSSGAPAVRRWWTEEPEPFLLESMAGLERLLHQLGKIESGTWTARGLDVLSQLLRALLSTLPPRGIPDYLDRVALEVATSEGDEAKVMVLRIWVDKLQPRPAASPSAAAAAPGP